MEQITVNYYAICVTPLNINYVNYVQINVESLCSLTRISFNLYYLRGCVLLDLIFALPQ